MNTLQNTLNTAQDVTDFIRIHSIKGFLEYDEGETLYELARLASHIGPCLEIGSYCGKSSLYLGTACQSHDNTLYAVDHHRGSEEHQLGEEYHDPDLYNNTSQHLDSFPVFRQTIDLSNLHDHIVPIITRSAILQQHWATPLGLVFIDGGHSPEMAMNDCLGWSQHVKKGGILAIHDIFPKPEDGGQGPFLAMQAVINSGDFEVLPQVNSLGILKRIR